MNRIILIGNGFDLAHGLKTSYADFIDWYWKEWGNKLLHGKSKKEEDGLCSFEINDSIGLNMWYYVWNGYYYKREKPWIPWDEHQVVELAKQNHELCTFSVTSTFFSEVCQDVDRKGWVDIENVFFKHLCNDSEKPEEVNKELSCVRKRLIDYLKTVTDAAPKELLQAEIQKMMLAPFDKRDMAIGSMDLWGNMLQQRVNYRGEQWDMLISSYLHNEQQKNAISDVYNYLNDNSEKIKKLGIEQLENSSIPKGLLFPDRILMVNFNYTSVADSYFPNIERFNVNHVHGELSNPESVVFGYGDEMDENYKILSNKNDNEYLTNIKSIKYLESPNYRNLLDFIESDTYQVFIMGHSCGNSDRTLLNTLFEHKNCVSIKPFYYIRENGTDNYMELVQNISRNFTDMKLMRDRVVNKTFCMPYSDEREKTS